MTRAGPRSPGQADGGLEKQGVSVTGRKHAERKGKDGSQRSAQQVMVAQKDPKIWVTENNKIKEIQPGLSWSPGFPCLLGDLRQHT